MTEIDIRRADQSDAAAVAATLHAAFRHDSVSCWIFPDEGGRERYHPGFMRLFVDLGLAEGEVYLTDDSDAVAVWFPIDPATPGDGSHFVERAAEHCGPYERQFRELDRRMGEHHPGERHLYLNFLATRPGEQSKGLGTALLRHRLSQPDATSQGAYLESSSTRSAALYAREGFVRREPFALGTDGPTMIPMWRPPQSTQG